MHAKTSWTVQALLICLILNGLFIGAIYYGADRTLSRMNQDYLQPLLAEGQAELPSSTRAALTGLKDLIVTTSHNLAPVLFGLGGAITLILWLLVQWRGRSLAGPYAQEKGHRQQPEVTSEVSPEAPGRYVQTSPEAAVQILSIMQRQGRLIDFLQEDLTAYNDAQVGAAVRVIHDGCRAALSEHVEIKPVYSEEEGTTIQVLPDFDSNAVRLTGHVSGDPPFKGVIRHRGWKVDRIELPRPMLNKKEKWILAPAEVEVAK